MSEVDNTIIYCRVSSKWQLDWWWLNSQQVSCKQHCARKGYKIASVFNDAFTGWDLNRPWLNRLFKFIDDNNKDPSKDKITVFLTEDISRIARDYQVHIELTKWLLKRWVRYETVNMTFEDTPAGKMIEGMMAIHSEYFRRNNQYQVINRQESRLLDWYRPWDYPLWYRTEKAPVGGKILVKDEPNASIVGEALVWYANDLFNSVKEVADFLQRKWLDLRRYKKKRKESNIIHTSLAQRMLTNILYSWHIEYKKTTRDKDGIIKKEWDISLREWKHEWLISLETYYKIQEKLAGKRPYTHESKVINDDYPLRWFVVCSCCQLPFTSWKSRSKNKQQIAYYQFNRKCIHKWKSISAASLHSIMNEKIMNIWIDDRFLSFMKILITEEHETRIQDSKLNQKNIDKSIADAQKEIDNLLSSLANTTSAIVQKKIEQKIEESELRRLRLVEQLKDLQVDVGITKVLDMAFDIMSNPYYIWHNGTVDQKQMLLRLLFSKKIPVDFSTRIYWTLPFSNLFLRSKYVSKQDYHHLEMTGFEPVSEKHI